MLAVGLRHFQNFLAYLVLIKINYQSGNRQLQLLNVRIDLM